MTEEYKLEILIDLFYNSNMEIKKRSIDEDIEYERKRLILFRKLEKIYSPGKNWERERKIRENTNELKDKLKLVHKNITITQSVLSPSYYGFKNKEQKQPLVDYLRELRQKELLYNLEMKYWQIFCQCPNGCRKYHPGQGYFGCEFICSICQRNTNKEDLYKPSQESINMFNTMFLNKINHIKTRLIEIIPIELINILMIY